VIDACIKTSTMAARAINPRFAFGEGKIGWGRETKEGAMGARTSPRGLNQQSLVSFLNGRRLKNTSSTFKRVSSMCTFMLLRNKQQVINNNNKKPA
jgi:hypothetical protein